MEGDRVLLCSPIKASGVCCGMCLCKRVRVVSMLSNQNALCVVAAPKREYCSIYLLS